MSDDAEFVARTGALWAWIDRVWESSSAAIVTLVALLLAVSLPWWVAVLPATGVFGLSWALIERERDRLFPPNEETA